jgi:hypothetical protein
MRELLAKRGVRDDRPDAISASSTDEAREISA